MVFYLFVYFCLFRIDMQYIGYTINQQSYPTINVTLL